MNYILISPTFPVNYWQFAKALKEVGVHILAIGEDHYHTLREELKASLTDYYQVTSLSDYKQMYQACAYFAYKYGKIDWLESNNEYWLVQDAKLRDDFNINTGYKSHEIDKIKLKSRMKHYYQQANIPTARYQLVSTLENAKEFIANVGYPVCVKPDDGVGANGTFKINNEEDLLRFFHLHLHQAYIMEEFIEGTIISYDGICDQQGNILFETCHYFPKPVMDIVNHQLETTYYSLKDIPEHVREVGTRVVNAFDIKARFFHLEFFILEQEKRGLGKKGDLVGLEVNMRPPGGYTTDMMNWANDIDVYQIYSQMINGTIPCIPNHRPYHAIYIGRRSYQNYVYSLTQLKEKYPSILLESPMASCMAPALGDIAIIARFKDMDVLKQFEHDATLKAE